MSPARREILAACPPHAPSRRTQEIAAGLDLEAPFVREVLDDFKTTKLIRESQPSRWIRLKAGSDALGIPHKRRRKT